MSTNNLPPSGRESHALERKQAQERNQEQRRSKIFAFRADELPAAESPVHPVTLEEHRDWVLAMAPLPDGNRVATACNDGFVRVFALGGAGDTSTSRAYLRTFEAHKGGVHEVCALGGDVLATSGREDGIVATWRASSGERVATLRVSETHALGMAVVGRDCIAVGAQNGESGDLVFLSHDGGRDLREDARRIAAHQGWIHRVVVHGNVLVTAASDITAAAWDAKTREKRAVLTGISGLVNVRAHTVWCAAINDRIIATGVEMGLEDNCIRIHRNGGDFALLAVLVGVHSDAIVGLTLVGDYLLSASFDETIAVTTITENGRPLVRARVSAGFPVLSAALLAGRRVAVGEDGGLGRVVLMNAPEAVFGEIGGHAAVV